MTNRLKLEDLFRLYPSLKGTKYTYISKSYIEEEKQKSYCFRK